MKDRKAIMNALSSALTYGILLVFSIGSSKFVLVEFGSEANGLLSSVNQLFAYIALLEAGIGTATIRALYQPIADKSPIDIADVLSASRSYYRSCAKWYFLAVVIVSILWPFLLETTIPFGTIWAVIFLQGISGVITFWFSSTVVNYLVASSRNYVNNNLHVVFTLLTYVIKIAICLSGLSIVTISAAMIGLNILKCLLYYLYLKKNCPEFFIYRKPNKALLKQRKSFLVHEISGVIFSSTDTVILSVFCGLNEASVYAVYSLVFNALRSIIGQMFTGTNYILGTAYSQGLNKYTPIHDNFNRIYVCAVFAIFTIAYIMILPFISLYTNGIADIDYMDSALPIMFVAIELLSACRIVDGQLIKNALHAKQTINRSIVEAIINLVISIIAVQYLGIYGVLLGTIVAMLYRTNDIIVYANKHILKRRSIKEYVLYGGNIGIFFLFVVAERMIHIVVDTYLQLFWVAIGVSLVVLMVYAVINFGVYYIEKRVSRVRGVYYSKNKEIEVSSKCIFIAEKEKESRPVRDHA